MSLRSQAPLSAASHYCECTENTDTIHHAKDEQTHQCLKDGFKDTPTNILLFRYTVFRYFLLSLVLCVIMNVFLAQLYVEEPHCLAC